MVSIYKYGNGICNPNQKEIYGLSTDEKPIDEINGRVLTNADMYYAMDTQEVWLFDEENKVWIAQE